MLTASILLFLLALIGVNGERLLYGDQIGDMSGEASNPEGSNPTGPFEFMSQDCKPLQTDGDLSTTNDALTNIPECQVRSSDVPRQFTWGAEPSVQDETVGMVGTFTAINVDPGTNPATGANYVYYTITSLSISFRGGCLNDMIKNAQDSQYFYTDQSGTTVVGGDVTATKENGVTTYSADLPSVGIRLYAGQDIGFDIQTNSYCEAGMEVVEFEVIGEPAETEEPTKSPTPNPTPQPTPQPTSDPTPSPTTAQPTMGPTSQCKGEVTWGDPHFRLMAFDNDAVDQFNYQALGWFFYIAPCDMSQFKYFPFFLLSYHTRCYWRGNPKGCINNNRLILNTNPIPIIITFDYRNLEIDLDIAAFEAQGGTIEVSPNAQQGNGGIKTNSNYQDKDGKRLEIVYNDGKSLPTRPNQSGKFVLFYDSDTIVIQLYDVQYDALPRRCNRNQNRGELLQCGENQCEDLVIDIRNKATWTYYTCPHCLRNIACGLMGKYIRGDCTKAQLWDPNHKCSKILVGVDGTVYRDSSNRARGDDTFAKMADTWALDNVETYLKNQYNYDINFAKEKNTIFKHKKQTFEKRALDPENITSVELDFYDGLCKNNIDHLRDVNEKCRQETVVKYEKCCKEIGICNILWSGCVEDYCSCTAPSNDKPANITDDWCMDTIIRDSMNATCSVDALWPTSTPTNAPTPSPTGLVAGLPKGQKAADLIWLYLIFVILFVIIAGVAYWYYRKKNGGKASFQDDVDSGVPNTSVGY